jgi:hypothetical protein
MEFYPLWQFGAIGTGLPVFAVNAPVLGGMWLAGVLFSAWVSRAA